MLKKAIYCIAGLLFFGFTSYAQKMHVSAEIAGLKDGEVIFNYKTGKSIEAAAAVIKDGKFEWKADIPEGQRISLYFTEGSGFFYAENGSIRITGSADSLNRLKVTGSRIHDEYQNYRKSLTEVVQKEQLIWKELGTASAIRKKELENELTGIRLEKRAIEKQYIISHPQSLLSVSMIAEQAFSGNYEQIDDLYQKLSKEVKKTVQAKYIVERMAVLKRSAIGAQVYNFKQSDTAGKMIEFSSFKGKYVLIDFWASWCGPCRAENPNVLKAYNLYKNKNFTVVGVSIDNDAAKWKKAIKVDQMPWTQLSDLEGNRNEVTTYYGINGIPSTLLVDPSGKIIAKDLRGVELQNKLEELMR